jgi:uncharacterized protein
MYQSPWWLVGAHAQTIWPAVVCPRPKVNLRRVRWETPDHDFIDLDLLDESSAPAPLISASPLSADTSAPPWVLLFHGLEGSSESHYSRALLAQAQARGWQAAVAHFRGCSGELNRLARSYHSGDSAEIDWVVRRFKREFAGNQPLYVAGVSLGGNALMKWAGEQGPRAEGVAQALAAVCPPQDLEAGAIVLGKTGIAQIYMRNFFQTLKPKSEAKWKRYPNSFDLEGMRQARNFAQFDEAVTAPLHGFASARQYWDRSSCRPFLKSIALPTLVINPLNDPFVPACGLAKVNEVSAQVLLEYPAAGGHVGFVQGGPPGNIHWLAQRLLNFFADHG